MRLNASMEIGMEVLILLGAVIGGTVWYRRYRHKLRPTDASGVIIGALVVKAMQARKDRDEEVSNG